MDGLISSIISEAIKEGPVMIIVVIVFFVIIKPTITKLFEMSEKDRIKINVLIELNKRIQGTKLHLVKIETAIKKLENDLKVLELALKELESKTEKSDK